MTDVISDDAVRQTEKALRALPEDKPLLTTVKAGTKEGAKSGYLDSINLLRPVQAVSRVRNGQNYGFTLGDKSREGTRLVVVDGENPDVFPDALTDWLTTFSHLDWHSVHGGLNYLLIVPEEAYQLLDSVRTRVSLTTEGGHDLELLTNGHAIGPGSTIRHEQCRETKPCDGTGVGQYTLSTVRLDAPQPDYDDIENLLDILGVGTRDSVDGSEQAHQSNDVEPVDLPDVSHQLVKEAEANLRAFQRTLGPGDERSTT